MGSFMLCDFYHQKTPKALVYQTSDGQQAGHWAPGDWGGGTGEWSAQVGRGGLVPLCKPCWDVGCFVPQLQHMGNVAVPGLSLQGLALPPLGPRLGL